jgi:hypothetical protein
MMKYLWILILLFESAHASQRSLNDFQGDQLVIGIGNFPYYLGQRTVHKETEYSIDIFKRVYPCLTADGLDTKTYTGMPDNRFSRITFEHTGVCPFARPDILTPQGMTRCESSGVYQADKWEASTNADRSVANELFRILKPSGRLVFMSSVLETKERFENINLWNDNLLAPGLKAWLNYYEKAGFEEIAFQFQEHEQLKGWFVQMVATKPSTNKKHKIN